jgi:hypothetical protein
VARYAILLYSPAPADPMELPEEELRLHGEFGDTVTELGGTIHSPFALAPSTTAAGIRGEVVTAGPFIESAEVLTGFFILEAHDLDHALAIARRNPSTIRGGVEVRPLFEPPA